MAVPCCCVTSLPPQKQNIKKIKTEFPFWGKPCIGEGVNTSLKIHGLNEYLLGYQTVSRQALYFHLNNGRYFFKELAKMGGLDMNIRGSSNNSPSK